MDLVFKIGQITTATASIIGMAVVTIMKSLGEGFVVFFCGAIFTLILRGIEQDIFASNIYHGRYCSHHY